MPLSYRIPKVDNKIAQCCPAPSLPPSSVTPSPTRTITPTITPTNTFTPTPTVSPTNSVTPTITATPTNSATPTNTATPTNSITPTNTATPTNSVTPTRTASATPTNSVTPTRTTTPTNTLTPTNSITPTNTTTPTNTITPTNTKPCSVIDYCGQCDENGDSQEDRTGIVATWTVTIPNEYTLPLQITFSGGVNDQLIVNGDVVGDGGDFTYVYTATQRSFVMSINNTGFGANATFQICPRLEIGPIDTGL